MVVTCKCSGMGDRHTSVEKYSLSEHAHLRRSLHHKVLLEHQRQGRIFLPENFASEPSAASDWALDEYYFLQPVPTRQRRAMLHEAGVVKIDTSEREECRSLRLSRGRCGCSCREFCQPPSCACYRSGIGCQVDQMAFPCSCTRSGCANPHGRVEFNAARVRAHFIRTLLQLGIEQNAAAESDSALSPPAKRCCFEHDQQPMSLLPSFSSASSSSLLINSSCAGSTSVPATNGFEPQTVYFDTVDGLTGPETMVVAYNEEYDDDDGESGSETSSDPSSFDGTLDDADNCSTLPAVHDPRQRTLDDYVVRFSQQQMYTDGGPTVAGSGSFASGFHLATVESSNAPISCAITCHNWTPQSPAVSSTADTTHLNTHQNKTARCYYMPNDTKHNCNLPHENKLIHAISDNYNMSLTHDNQQSYYTTDNVRSNYSVLATTDCSTQRGAVGRFVVTYSAPKSSAEGTACVYNTVDDSKQHCYLSEDATCSTCFTAETKSIYSTQENTLHVPGLTGSYHTQHNDAYSTLNNSVPNTDSMTHISSLPKQSRNGDIVSSTITYGCNTAQSCSVQQETDNYSTLTDTVCSESLLHDTGHRCCFTSNNTTHNYSVTADNETCGGSISHVDTLSYSTTDTSTNYLSVTHSDTPCNTLDNTTYSHSVHLETKCEHFVPHDSSWSMKEKHDILNTEDAAHAYCLPDNNTNRSIVTSNICSLDDIAIGRTTPDTTHVCVITENTQDDCNMDNTMHGSSVPNNSLHSDSIVNDSSHCYAASGDIVHGSSMLEQATNDSFVPNTVVGCSLPDEQSSLPQSNGNSYSIPAYTTISCPDQENTKLDYSLCLEDSNSIAVTAVTELSPPLQDGNYNACSAYQLSCTLTEMHSEGITIDSENASDVSSMVNVATSVTCTISDHSDDLSSQHSAPQESIAQTSVNMQPCSAITVSSNQPDFVGKSSDSQEPHDTIAAQNFIHTAECSLNNNEGIQTTLHTLPSTMALCTDQMFLVESLASDFHNTSNTSCCVEDSEYTCDVSNVTSMSECSKVDNNCVMNSTLNSVSEDSQIACHAAFHAEDVDLAATVTLTMNCDADHKNSMAYSTVDAVTSESEDT